MLTFLKYLIQLILSPANGWNDLAERNPDPEVTLRRDLYPLIGVLSATEFLSLVYPGGSGLVQVISAAVTEFGAFFISIFLARLVLDFTLPKLCDAAPSQSRTYTFINATTGLMVLFRIIDNCLPWNLMLMKFLPLYVVLVISKSGAYMGVRKRDDMRFLGIAAGLTVAVPLGIYYLIYLLVQ